MPAGAARSKRLKKGGAINYALLGGLDESEVGASSHGEAPFVSTIDAPPSLRLLPQCGAPLISIDVSPQ